MVRMIGSIDLSVSGGTSPGCLFLDKKMVILMYSSSSQDISDLSPGTYQIIVTDANGCMHSLSDMSLLVSVNK